MIGCGAVTRQDSSPLQASVLLIEDSAGDASLVRAALGSAPSAVVKLTWVQTASEARRQLRDETFDCILLDLGLPDADGLDVLAEVFAEDPTVAVVVLTGRDDDEIAREALHRGAQDYLPKHELDDRVLVRSLRYAIDRQAVRGALRHSEAHHRRVIEALAEGVVVANSAGEIQTANASARSILGLRTGPSTGNGAPRVPWTLVDETGAPLSTEDLPASVSLKTGRASVGTIMGVAQPERANCVWLEVNATPLFSEGAYRPYGVVTSFRDITKRRIAEQALRDSERRQRLVLQNASEGHAVVDPDGLVRDHSPSLQQWWPLQDLRGSNALSWLHPADLGAARDWFAAVTAAVAQPKSVEVRAIVAGGATHWLEITGTNWLHEPTVAGIVLNYRDVSERRAAEEKIRFQARMLDAVGQAVIVTDAAGHVVYWNPAAAEMYGWTAEEAAGRDIVALAVSDELAERSAQIFQQLWAGETWSGDCWMNRRDGTQFPVLLSTTPVFGDDGSLQAIISVCTDISERKRTEDAMRELSAIVESSDDAIIGKTLDGLIRSWNGAATKLYGYEPHEVINRHISVIAPEDRVAEIMRIMERVRAAERIEHFETVRRRKDGTLVDVSVTVSPIYDRDGRLVGASASARDISQRKSMERAAAEDRRRLEEAQGIAGLGSFEFDRRESSLRCSKEQYRLLGLDPGEPLSIDRFLAVVHQDDRPSVEAAIRALCERDEPMDTVHRIVRREHETRWVHTRATPTADSDGQSTRVVGTMLDVTERKRFEDELRLAEARVRLGFEHAAIGVVTTDIETRITMVNPAMCQLLGRSEAELLGRKLFDFTHPEDRRTEREATADLLAGRQSNIRREHRLLRSDGQAVWVLSNVSLVREDDDRPAYLFAQVQDIARRKETERALEHLALHDPLTALPNRSLLTDRIDQARRRTRRRGGLVAVLFLDLDRFKLINDSLGHGVGDDLLVAVAERLKGAVRPSDTIARFGGDEFVIVCEDLARPSHVAVVSERIARALDAPFAIDGRELYVSASIGVSVVRDGDSAEDAVRNADAAMYRAKERGRGRVELYDEALRRNAAERLETEGALRRALERQEFALAYQPVIRLADGAVVGCEALLRWQHPQRGTVSPAEFIPLAEETGLILPIGQWALNAAFKQVQRWRAELPGCENLWVAVNLSAVQLLAPDLVAVVADALVCSGLDPSAVHLEITETVLMSDVQRSIETLVDLKALGVRIAVDDFGTGYSSLSYLKSLPIDTLKIDQSFVAGLGTDVNDSSIVRAIVGLGQALGLELLGEGVETVRQLNELESLGCELAQGFMWSAPLFPAAFAADIFHLGASTARSVSTGIFEG